jgi:hypothetical protein
MPQLMPSRKGLSATKSATTGWSRVFPRGSQEVSPSRRGNKTPHRKGCLYREATETAPNIRLCAQFLEAGRSHS